MVWCRSESRVGCVGLAEPTTGGVNLRVSIPSAGLVLRCDLVFFIGLLGCIRAHWWSCAWCSVVGKELGLVVWVSGAVYTVGAGYAGEIWVVLFELGIDGADDSGDTGFSVGVSVARVLERRLSDFS